MKSVEKILKVNGKALELPNSMRLSYVTEDNLYAVIDKIETYCETREMEALGLGYTIGTGRLFCEVDKQQKFAKEMLNRPVYIHEFASTRFWADFRDATEAYLQQEKGTKNE